MAVGYGYSVLGDWHLAEDAAQEAFVSAYHGLSQLREPGAFPGWFRTVVFKHCHRLVRNKRVVTAPLDRALQVVDRFPSPVEHAEQREQHDYVAAAIRALSDQQRSVVTLFYISDYSCAEIAAFLDIPVATVKTRLYAARKQLHKRMLYVIHDNLSDQRPSRDDRFAERVLRLFAASAEGDTQTVQSLLVEDPALVDASSKAHTIRYSDAVLPLHVAVMHGQKNVIDVLLAQGADINAKDIKGMSALHHALDLSFLPD